MQLLGEVQGNVSNDKLDVTEADYDTIFLSVLSVPLLDEISLTAGAEKVVCSTLV